MEGDFYQTKYTEHIINTVLMLHQVLKCLHAMAEGEWGNNCHKDEKNRPKVGTFQRNELRFRGIYIKQSKQNTGVI